MGGQACVLYGAAEFSRDVDIVIPPDDQNLDRFRLALAELEAQPIAVPPFEADYLKRGHAVHFRCAHPDAMGMRLDVMSALRGVDEFSILWERRIEIEDDLGSVIPVIGIEDLVKAKKTQREKDWPMIRRLVETHYSQHLESPTPEQITFWLRESRTSEMLYRLGRQFPEEAKNNIEQRQFLWRVVCFEELPYIDKELEDEQMKEMYADRRYWNVLKAELEQLRNQRLDQLRKPPAGD